MLQQPLRIIVDNRERNIGIIESLEEQGIDLNFAQLPVGDYIISDRICIERKTASDFESSIMNNVQEVVNTWCKKEYGNLKAAEMAGVRAPRPYYFRGNVLAMEFIGYDGKPANTLKETELAEPQEVLDMILSDLRKLYKAEFVHGDVSEYNILMNLGTPYLIDFGQAVVLNHPRAMEFLKRDVHNITAYFARKYGIMNDEETIVGQITGR